MMDFRKPRDRILVSISTLATRYKITPNMVSIAGIASMVLFGISVFMHATILALIFLCLSVFADLLDGSLARYQKVASDKGKKFDLIADNITFTIFMISLGLANLISLFVAILIIILQIIITVQSTKNAISSISRTGLRIHEVQGFWITISVVKAIMYASFIVSAFISVETSALMRLVAILLLVFSLLRGIFRKA
jgi:phosphatidylglycerophosphate synthase